MKFNKGTGANISPNDIRTFAYEAKPAKQSGGKRWTPKDIQDQDRVGICTAISLTMQASKVYGVKMSADFQYLIQKKYYDKNWDEGSSAFHSLKAGKDIGFLPEKEWKFTKQSDRAKPYHTYIKLLQAVSDKEIEKLIKKAKKYRLKAFEYVAPDRDLMANAIDNSECGIITRYTLDSQWWTAPIQPLRSPKQAISGHLVTDTNYDGRSFRIANSWGTDWATKGTAYRLHHQYAPTEAWLPYFTKLPISVKAKLKKRKTVKGKVDNFLQKIIKKMVK